MLYKIPWFVRYAMADHFRSDIEDMPSSMTVIDHEELGKCFYYNDCIVVPGPLDFEDPKDSWALITEEYKRERHTIIQQVSDTEYTIVRSDCVPAKESVHEDQPTDKDIRAEEYEQKSAQADI